MENNKKEKNEKSPLEGSADLSARGVQDEPGEYPQITGEEFAKVFDLNGMQLLVFWESDDDDGYQLNQIIKTNFGDVNLKIGHSELSVIKQIFKGYDQALAERFIDHAQSDTLIYLVENHE